MSYGAMKGKVNTEIRNTRELLSAARALLPEDSHQTEMFIHLTRTVLSLAELVDELIDRDGDQS